MAKFRKYTEEQLKIAITESASICQVLTKLGVAPRGGNYVSVNNYISQNKIDVSHFKGRGWNKGQIIGPKRPISDYLANTFSITSHKLRKRLIAEKIFEPRCSNCNLSDWFSQPIPLELEHKDGNHENNSLENLCLLCPNCHALTSTYRGKNKYGTRGGFRTPTPVKDSCS